MDETNINEQDQQESWKTSPEEHDEKIKSAEVIDVNEAVRSSASRMWRDVGRVSPCEDRRFSQGEDRILLWKAPLITFGVGIPGLALVCGQWWFPGLFRMLGDPTGEYVILWQMLALLLGVFLLFIAAPIQLPADWTPEKQEELDQSRDYFRKKRGL